SMIQLVLGAAVGFLVGQGVLHTVKSLNGWFQREEVGERVRSLQGAALVGTFVKYSGVVGAVGALITLGVWAVEDYMAARSTHAALNAPDLPVSAPVPGSDLHGSTAAVATPPPEVSPNVAHAVPARLKDPDPYSDPEFKVQRRPRRGGTAVSLKETLVQ